MRRFKPPANRGVLIRGEPKCTIQRMYPVCGWNRHLSLSHRPLSPYHSPMNTCPTSSASPQTRDKKRDGIGFVSPFFQKFRAILALLLDITLETNTPAAPPPSFPPPSGNPGGGGGGLPSARERRLTCHGKARSLHRSLTLRTTAPYNPKLQPTLFLRLCLKGPTSPRDDGVSAGMASWLV